MSDKDYTDIKKVKELIDIMKQNDLIELEIADGDNKIILKRPSPATGPIPAHMPAATVTATAGPAETATEPQGLKLAEITSPIVGTFYASPSPDAEPFVTVGSKVNADTVVCIIEAMKVMNEIKAEISGTIEQVLCQGGQAVEYGQVLFNVRPD